MVFDDSRLCLTVASLIAVDNRPYPDAERISLILLSAGVTSSTFTSRTATITRTSATSRLILRMFFASFPRSNSSSSEPLTPGEPVGYQIRVEVIDKPRLLRPVRYLLNQMAIMLSNLSQSLSVQGNPTHRRGQRLYF